MEDGIVDHIALFFLVLGGFNWALTVWTDFNLVTTALGWWAWGPKLLYSLVGLSAVYGLWMLVRDAF